jgi:hypothetical protein
MIDPAQDSAASQPFTRAQERTSQRWTERAARGDTPTSFEPSRRQGTFRGYGDQALSSQRAAHAAHPGPVQAPQTSGRGVQSSLFSRDEISNPPGPGPSNFNQHQFRTQNRQLPGTPPSNYFRSGRPQSPRMGDTEAPPSGHVGGQMSFEDVPPPPPRVADNTVTGPSRLLREAMADGSPATNASPSRTLPQRTPGTNFSRPALTGQGPLASRSSQNPPGSIHRILGADRVARGMEDARSLRSSVFNAPPRPPGPQEPPIGGSFYRGAPTPAPPQQQGPSPQNLNPVQQAPQRSRATGGQSHTQQVSGGANFTPGQQDQTGSWHSYDPAIGAAGRAVTRGAKAAWKGATSNTGLSVAQFGLRAIGQALKPADVPTTMAYNTSWRQR